MAYLPAEVKANLEGLSEQLDRLEEHLAPVLEFDSLTQLNG